MAVKKKMKRSNENNGGERRELTYIATPLFSTHNEPLQLNQTNLLNQNNAKLTLINHGKQFKLA
ncbi:hypothetical protein ACDT16_13950, partial [Staphylococcus aureus]